MSIKFTLLAVTTLFFVSSSAYAGFNDFEDNISISEIGQEIVYFGETKKRRKYRNDNRHLPIKTWDQIGKRKR